jgi:hypothetical protein
MRQITLSTLEYPTDTNALVRLQEDVLRINDPKAFKAHNWQPWDWLACLENRRDDLHDRINSQPV